MPSIQPPKGVLGCVLMLPASQLLQQRGLVLPAGDDVHDDDNNDDEEVENENRNDQGRPGVQKRTGLTK